MTRRRREGAWAARPARIAVVAAASIVLAWLGAPPALASILTVCAHGCAYTQIAAAVAGAANGDTLEVGPGTYQGGFTIDKNLTLDGAGAVRTTIRGGGPVVTVGLFDAATEPTVTLRGFTVTGGSNHSSEDVNFSALGGGISVPRAANLGIGATLTIIASVISGNSAYPLQGVDSGVPCPVADCVFAHAGGGGIYSSGTLVVDDTTISNNVAGGPVTSDANGGGVYVQEGSLTMNGSVVTGNRANATIPDGRFAEGGGIMVDTSRSGPGVTATLSVANSTVSDNSATLTSVFPSFAGGQQLEMNANAGGIHVGDAIPTTINRTSITGNSAIANDPNGEPIGIDAGVNVGNSTLVMNDSLIADNDSTTIAATSDDVGPSGSAIELDGGGTISDTRIVDNTAISRSADGSASVNGGLAVLNFNSDPQLVTVQDSVIADNVTQAFSSTGSATVLGGGVFNNVLLLMRNVQVTRNVGRAEGPSGAAEGAGIWNGVYLSGPPVELTLDNTAVTYNTLAGSAAITLQGAGVYTTTPVSLTHTTIAMNRPDQCVGCGTGAATLTPSIATAISGVGPTSPATQSWRR